MGFGMTAINRLLAFYLSALAVLFLSVAASFFLTDRLATQIASDASAINVSGRQRMLSQRIMYLAYDLAAEPADETREALLATIADFEAALVLFAQSHERLTAVPELDVELSRIYFSAEDGPSLDARVKTYIALGRSIAEDPENAASLVALRDIERGGLLRDLDVAVSRFEELSVEKAAGIRQAEYVSLAIAALIVLAEITFVFLPGHRMIRRNVREIEDTKQALELESDRLQAALAESQALQHEQAAFTYAVSHDLKSPANSLQLLLDEIDLSVRDIADEDTRDMLDQSHRTVRRMSTLVEDVLAYAWATDHREEQSVFDLSDVADEVLEAVDGEVRTAGAEVRVGPLPRMKGYRRQMSMMLQNLVSNAVKYRDPERSVVIDVSAKVEGPDTVRLVVSDNGMGISEEHLDRVFEMFQRLHRQDEIIGSGLGLSTCQRVAANHSGHVEVASTPGQGSTFTVVLRVPVMRDELHEEVAA